MRNELELMETIDNYINGNLSETDKVAFEKKLAADPELQKEVNLQKELIKGIERNAIKQSAKKGFKKYKFNKQLKNWGLMGLTVAVVTLSSFFIYHTIVKNKAPKENAANVLPELNEQGERLWSDADKYLPLQSFEVDNEKDTIIETADGIVFAIPANSFLTADGKPVEGNIQLEVKEALKAADIMKAGLNTKSGDKLLETGGMFYINARQDDVSLKIDAKKPIYAEVPTNEVKPGMQLFEGKRLADGTIDWVNPKPIQKDLIPVDILSLNFYPPNYLDSLKNWGYNIKDKKFTDSLYYSFASLFSGEAVVRRMGMKDSSKADTIMNVSSSYFVLRNKKSAQLVTLTNSQLGAIPNWEEDYEFLRMYSTSERSGEKIFNQNCAACHSMGTNKVTGPGLEGIGERVPGYEWLVDFIKNNKALIASGDPYANKIFKENGHMDMTIFNYLSDDEMSSLIAYITNSSVTKTSYSGINPAKIKTIWSSDFQNTLISTREFAERLPVIFKTCNEGILDLYINNLDKNLSTIDSMAAGWETGESRTFLKFASRGDGKVKNWNKNVQLLKRYYAEKTKIYTEAIVKTVDDFKDDQLKKNMEAGNKRAEYINNDNLRNANNFQEELNRNLNEAYRQLGMKAPKSTSGKSYISQGPPIPPAAYGVSISSTGWCNIDSYTLNATIARTTIDYTDKETGKKAVINYEPLVVSINNSKNYDRILVYLLPDELNSFMRVEKKNETYEEKLNELMIYKMVCIAYKGEESFYFSQDNVKSGKLSISLIKTSNAEIQNDVNKINNLGQVKAMNDELNYMAFEKEETKRQAQLVKINELTNKVRPVVLPCSFPADSISEEKMDSLYSAAAKK